VSLLVPALFAGFAPIPISILLVSVVTFVSFILVSGFSRKTYAAILGTICGISIAGLISIIVSHTANLSGVNMEGGEQLLNIAPDYNLKLNGLLFISILIASLGAVMDVSMSVSSSMHEILTIDPAIEKKKLFKSGLNVGKDITGTMISVVLFTNIAAIIPNFVISVANDIEYRTVLRFDAYFDIVRFFMAAVAILISIPVSVLVSSLMLKRGGKRI